MTEHGTNWTRVKAALRTLYAWPGGYRLLFLTDDGAVLCADCVRNNWRQICSSRVTGSSDGWRVVEPFVHWEGEPEVCAHCNAEFESEYGETND